MNDDNPVVAIDYKCQLCGTAELFPLAPGQPGFFSMADKWCNCMNSGQPTMCEVRFIRKLDAVPA